MNKSTAVEQVDLDLADRAAGVRRNPLVRTAGWISELADQPPLISICVATTMIGAFARNRRMTRAGATMLAAELLATQIKTSVKKRVDRTRPAAVDDGRDYQMRSGSSRESEESSFRRGIPRVRSPSRAPSPASIPIIASPPMALRPRSR